MARPAYPQANWAKYSLSATQPKAVSLRVVGPLVDQSGQLRSRQPINKKPDHSEPDHLYLSVIRTNKLRGSNISSVGVLPLDGVSYKGTSNTWLWFPCSEFSSFCFLLLSIGFSRSHHATAAVYSPFCN